MSMSFFPEMSEIAGYAFACGHGSSSHRLPHAEAMALLSNEIDRTGRPGVLSECGQEECAKAPLSIIGIESDPGPHVQMSGTNAARLLKVLGLTVELGGSEDAAVFLGLVEAAQALTQEGSYEDRRLEDLHDVAVFAVDRGRKVCWS